MLAKQWEYCYSIVKLVLNLQEVFSSFRFLSRFDHKKDASLFLKWSRKLVFEVLRIKIFVSNNQNNLFPSLSQMEKSTEVRQKTNPAFDNTSHLYSNFNRAFIRMKYYNLQNGFTWRFDQEIKHLVGIATDFSTSLGCSIFFTHQGPTSGGKWDEKKRLIDPLSIANFDNGSWKNKFLSGNCSKLIILRGRFIWIRYLMNNKSTIKCDT